MVGILWIPLYKYIYPLVAVILSLASHLEVPHFNMNSLFRLILLRRRVYLINDGLDLFRKIPKNISKQQLRNVVGLYCPERTKSSLSAFYDDVLVMPFPENRIMTDVTADRFCGTLILVESPGIDPSIVLELRNRYRSVVVWRHPNINKRVDWGFEHDEVEGENFDDYISRFEDCGIIFGETNSYFESRSQVNSNVTLFLSVPNSIKSNYSIL